MTRPKLNQVFRNKSEAEATPAPRTTPPAAGQGQMVQLNVKVSADLRRAARLKALQEERDLADVVRELLAAWVAD